MLILDFFFGLLRAALRLLLLALAALVGLGVLGLGLLAGLAWLLVNLLRGRRPHLALRGHWQTWRSFGRGWGSSAAGAGSLWPRRRPAGTDEDTKPAPPLAGRVAPPGPVVDVEFREPSQRQDP